MDTTLLIIKPPEASLGMATKAHGTRVVTFNGADVGGVTSIELIAKPNDVWRARIDCLVSIDGNISAIAEVRHPLSWWQRLCLRAAGIRAGRGK